MKPPAGGPEPCRMRRPPRARRGRRRRLRHEEAAAARRLLARGSVLACMAGGGKLVLACVWQSGGRTEPGGGVGVRVDTRVYGSCQGSTGALCAMLLCQSVLPLGVAGLLPCPACPAPTRHAAAAGGASAGARRLGARARTSACCARCVRSRWRSTWTTRPSLRCTAWCSTTSCSTRRRRTASSTTCWTRWTSTRRARPAVGTLGRGLDGLCLTLGRLAAWLGR